MAEESGQVAAPPERCRVAVRRQQLKRLENCAHRDDSRLTRTSRTSSVSCRRSNGTTNNLKKPLLHFVTIGLSLVPCFGVQSVRRNVRLSFWWGRPAPRSSRTGTQAPQATSGAWSIATSCGLTAPASNSVPYPCTIVALQSSGIPPVPTTTTTCSSLRSSRCGVQSISGILCVFPTSRGNGLSEKARPVEQTPHLL